MNVNPSTGQQYIVSMWDAPSSSGISFGMNAGQFPGLGLGPAPAGLDDDDALARCLAPRRLHLRRNDAQALHRRRRRQHQHGRSQRPRRHEGAARRVQQRRVLQRRPRRHPHLQHRPHRDAGCGSGGGERLGWHHGAAASSSFRGPAPASRPTSRERPMQPARARRTVEASISASLTRTRGGAASPPPPTHRGRGPRGRAHGLS